jgi:TPR repeat protein
MKRERPTAVESALRAHEAGKKVSAFRQLKRLAEANDEAAYFMLGYLYDSGEGTRRSKKKAMFWYLKSFSLGNSSAATNIATIYRDARDPVREFEWYCRAAELGDGDADLEVAIRLLSGKGVRSNVKLAIMHLRSVGRESNTSEAARDTAKQLLRGCA